MKEQLVSYLTALMAFQKGFDWPCYACYLDKKLEYWFAGNTIEAQCIGIEDIMEELGPNNDYAPRAPTQSLLQKWLRDNRNIYIEIKFPIETDNSKIRFWVNIYEAKHDRINIRFAGLQFYSSYEEALEGGLQSALELIEL